MMNKDDFKMKYPIDIDEYPNEIAETLLSMIQKHDDIDDMEEIEKELVDGIYYVRTCAENSYNSDYFRVLYSVLAKITENYGMFQTRSEEVKVSRQDFVNTYKAAVDEMFENPEDDENEIYGKNVTVHWNGIYCDCEDGASVYNYIIPAIEDVMSEID
jgi:hypothetical protein